VHKFHEARHVLKEFGISTAMLNQDTTEIQADRIDAIAEASASEAAKKCNMPIFVEDAGLFINAFNGFPGPYSSYVYRTLGNQGILKLLGEVTRRDAYFYSCVAFSDPANANLLKCFSGKVEGNIALRESGSHGFGFDPIFEPSAMVGRTFAEMTEMEKNKYSHRARALRSFGSWYMEYHAQLKLNHGKTRR